MMRQRGFTLMEVMIALAVFAIAIVGLSKSFDTAVNNATRLEEKTFAHWVALNHIAQMRAAGKLPGIGKQEAKDKLANREWTVEVETTAMPVSPKLRKVDIRVSLSSDKFGEKKRPITT
ncbi:MAG TPA: type II secretion system minor pseudopilin GspI, partial [Pseudomonadales bacterium]|nr:type II secretion system minor pseudopilin GspI [Pseudomonadales bacterium]